MARRAWRGEAPFRTIIERLIRLSGEFGAAIRDEKGIGVWQATKNAPSSAKP